MRGVTLAVLMILAVGQQAWAKDKAEYNRFEDMTVSDDVTALPQAVQDTRAALIAVTKSGDITGLKAIFDAQGTPPQVSYGGPGDAVEYLTTASADGGGIETLAVLRNLLEMPYAIIGATSENPTYIWPYLAETDITALTPAQMVDVYRLMPPEYAKSLAEMEGWYYWRAFIEANGELSSFIAGD